MIPYGKQSIDQDDIDAVVEVLQSDWLTTGPKVEEFEQAFAEFCGAKHAVAVSNGTAALHCAVYAAGIQPGDEVIVSPMTFAASSNCVLFMGATPVFADVRPDNLLIDPVEVEKKITGNTKAVIAIDYAGHPCDYDALRDVANRHGLTLIADACHAAGGNFRERPVGSLADFSTFSFHPVKHMTTGEGGMVTTDSAEFAEKMRIFRNHGITTDHRQRQQQGSWFYEMTDLGFNYRITDIQCALGISQLRKLPEWVEKRREIAAFYDREFRALSGVVPLTTSDDVHHAYHLYVVRTSASRRNQLFDTLRAKGVGVNVHYIPVHLHPYYRQTFNTGEGLCPNAETAYEQILSLPIYPELKVAEQEYVIETLFALT